MAHWQRVNRNLAQTGPLTGPGYSAKVATVATAVAIVVVVGATVVVIAVEVEAGSRRQTAVALRLAH